MEFATLVFVLMIAGIVVGGLWLAVAVLRACRRRPDAEFPSDEWVRVMEQRRRNTG